MVEVFKFAIHGHHVVFLLPSALWATRLAYQPTARIPPQSSWSCQVVGDMVDSVAAVRDTEETEGRAAVHVLSCAEIWPVDACAASGDIGP